MAPAQEDLVFDLSPSAVQPVHEVMAVAPGSRPVAARPAAVLVPCDQSPAARPFDGPLRSPDVDDDGVLEQDAAQARVAGPALHLRGPRAVVARGEWAARTGSPHLVPPPGRAASPPRR